MTIEFSKQCIHCHSTEWCTLFGDDWICKSCYLYLVDEFEMDYGANYEN